MDAFDDESQVADSQATQLIDHLLDPENVSNYDPRPASFSSNLAVTNDSPGSPQNSASFPNYHFHGLADTQSQSPVHPFNGAHLDKLTQHIVIGEGSQKENIDTYSTDKDTTKAQLSASPLRASFSVSSKAANTDSRSHSLSKTTSRNVIKKSSTSALHSPSKPERTENKNTPLFRDPPTINRYKQRPRPKSRESSVDSFARDFSPDRRAEFIASVPQFHIPISELGRVLDATTDKAMPAYSKRGRNNVPRSSSQGIVLVESTPSNSSQSQSQSLSHQYIETQPLNPSQDPEFFGRQSFAPEPSDDGNDGYVSSSSSSINRLLEAPIPSPQLEPTQPATQPDEDLSIRNLDEEEEIEEAQQVLPPPAPTVRTTAPRSLLDSLPDAKRQRYQQFQRAHDDESEASNVHNARQGLQEYTVARSIPEDNVVTQQAPVTAASTSRTTDPHSLFSMLSEGKPYAAPSVRRQEWHNGRREQVVTESSLPMREDNAVAQHAPQTVASTSLNTDPRPLFSTLTEHKRLRYQQYAMSSVRQQEQPTLHRPTSAKSKSRSLQEGSAKMQPTDDTSAAGQSHQHSSVSNDTDKEETQLCSPGEGVPRRRVSPPSNHLSNTTAVHRSPDSPLGNRQESRRRMVTPVSRSLSPLPPTQSSANRRSIKKPGSIIQDRMEVIPDSEPLRGSSPEEVCSEKTDSRQVDSKLHTGTHRNEKIDDAMDIVLDSVTEKETYEETDEEDGGTEHPMVAQRKEEEEEEEEEKDEDEEEDIPLATKIATKRKPPKATLAKDVKGKGKVPAAAGRITRAKNSSNAAPTETSNDKAKGKGKQSNVTSNRNPVNGILWAEDMEVPTSLPEQDLLKTTCESRVTRGQKLTTINAYNEVPEVDGHTGDVATEPAHSDNMDIDDLKPGPSSRKRKRGIQADLPVATRASARRSKPKKTSNTPVVRQSKRLRSVTATVASEEDAREGTRVFAVWMGDGHFYAAKVHSYVKEDQFKLYFDDDTTSVVPITQMRSFSLRIGDEVLTGGSSRPYKVVGLEDRYVKIRNDDETVTRELSLIRISGKTIECEWKDRILLMNNVMTMSGPVKLTTSPTPSRLLVANTIPKPAKRMPLNSKKVLAKTGLVVTLSVTNDNWGSDKVNIINSIRSAGGIVVDDFSSVINMEGKHAYNNNQWVIEKKDVKWIGDKNIERLFLIADDANQKPKFLIALALGIPCLSRSWVDDCIGKGEDREWLTYTLPQGYSAALNGRPSQQVDVDWGNSIHYLKDIMSNSVPCKLFSKMSILVLGADMVPMPKGKCLPGVEEKAQEAHNALARIILAMGASRVEAVSDLKYASATTADYDLIVIRDADRYTQELPSHTTVHWTWVKDCLVASRFLSRPQWCYIDLENSQEA